MQHKASAEYIYNNSIVLDWPPPPRSQPRYPGQWPPIPSIVSQPTIVDQWSYRLYVVTISAFKASKPVLKPCGWKHMIRKLNFSIFWSKFLKPLLSQELIFKNQKSEAVLQCSSTSSFFEFWYCYDENLLGFLLWKSNFGFIVFATSLCSDFSDFLEVFKPGKSLSAEI